jgi:hypothetical protein
MTSFVLKCLRKAQGNNLCAYYVCDIYFLESGSKNKQHFAMFQLILKIIIISIFLFFYRSIGCGISSFHRKGFGDSRSHGKIYL